VRSFFSQLSFFFFPSFIFVFQNDSVSDQNYIDPFFPLVCKNASLKQTVHWGPLESTWIFEHFQQKGIDILGTMKNVVGLGYETMQELKMKERNAT
jgi:hypothetical protein